MTPRRLAALVWLAGAAAMVAAVALIYLPAGLFSAGVITVVFATFALRGMQP